MYSLDFSIYKKHLIKGRILKIKICLLYLGIKRRLRKRQLGRLNKVRVENDA